MNLEGYSILLLVVNTKMAAGYPTLPILTQNLHQKGSQKVWIFLGRHASKPLSQKWVCFITQYLQLGMVTAVQQEHLECDGNSPVLHPFALQHYINLGEIHTCTHVRLHHNPPSKSTTASEGQRKGGSGHTPPPPLSRLVICCFWP